MSYAINSFYGNLLAYFLHQWSIKMPFVNMSSYF